MIRLTLRQCRIQAVISFGLLAVLAIVLVITGIHLAQANDSFQAACRSTGNCSAAANPVLQVDQGLQALAPMIAIAAPAFIGLFFGAPLIARELETGTFRLAWTQSVTLRRWLAVKLGLVGLAAVLMSVLLTWVVDWWEGPLDAASQNSFAPGSFDFHGVVPIGYAAFAFALGVIAGVLLRRTVAAMVATLVGFVVARVAVATWVRPSLTSPLHQYLSLTATHVAIGMDASTNTLSLTNPVVSIPNGWVYSSEVVDNSGHTVTGQYVLHACPGVSQILNAGPAAGPPVAIHQCLQTLSTTLHALVTYQPPSRFWPFQWTELGIFLAAALALCGLAYWWLRRQYG